jgi:hypothetical protein
MPDRIQEKFVCESVVDSLESDKMDQAFLKSAIVSTNISNQHVLNFGKIP